MDPYYGRRFLLWIPCRGAAAHARATRGMERVCVCARRPLPVRRERRRFNSKVKRLQGRAHSKSPVIDAAVPPSAMHCVMRFVADAATIADGPEMRGNEMRGALQLGQVDDRFL